MDIITIEILIGFIIIVGFVVITGLWAIIYLLEKIKNLLEKEGE